MHRTMLHAAAGAHAHGHACSRALRLESPRARRNSRNWRREFFARNLERTLAASCSCLHTRALTPRMLDCHYARTHSADVARTPLDGARHSSHCTLRCVCVRARARVRRAQYLNRPAPATTPSTLHLAADATTRAHVERVAREYGKGNLPSRSFEHADAAIAHARTHMREAHVRAAHVGQAGVTRQPLQAQTSMQRSNGVAYVDPRAQREAGRAFWGAISDYRARQATDAASKRAVAGLVRQRAPPVASIRHVSAFADVPLPLPGSNCRCDAFVERRAHPTFGETCMPNAAPDRRRVEQLVESRAHWRFADFAVQRR